MTETPLPSPIAGGQNRTLARIATASALAVVLGLAVQALVLSAKLAGGAHVEALRAVVDVAAGVTWSLVVCTGVAAATSALRARPVVAGVVSLICAPVAIALARAVQQVLAAALKAGEPGALALGAVAAVKSAEYGLLGYLLATLVRRETAGFSSFALSGLAVGIVFGGAVVALGAMAGAPSTALIATALNEIVFPVGCAGVVYVGRLAGRAAG